jgi:F-type H+-transporting ATPase subunit epsilon
MRVTVISPERAVFDGDATAVTAPAYDGLVGILPGHAPFVTLLGEGNLSVHSGNEVRTFSVSQGFLQVIDDTVRVVAEHAAAGDTTKGER